MGVFFTSNELPYDKKNFNIHFFLKQTLLHSIGWTLWNVAYLTARENTQCSTIFPLGDYSIGIHFQYYLRQLNNEIKWICKINNFTIHDLKPYCFASHKVMISNVSAFNIASGIRQ